MYPYNVQNGGHGGFCAVPPPPLSLYSFSPFGSAPPMPMSPPLTNVAMPHPMSLQPKRQHIHAMAPPPAWVTTPKDSPETKEAMDQVLSQCDLPAGTAVDECSSDVRLLLYAHVEALLGQRSGSSKQSFQGLLRFCHSDYFGSSSFLDDIRAVDDIQRSMYDRLDKGVCLNNAMLELEGARVEDNRAGDLRDQLMRIFLTYAEEETCHPSVYNLRYAIVPTLCDPSSPKTIFALIGPETAAVIGFLMHEGLLSNRRGASRDKDLDLYRELIIALIRGWSTCNDALGMRHLLWKFLYPLVPPSKSYPPSDAYLYSSKERSPTGDDMGLALDRLLIDAGDLLFEGSPEQELVAYESVHQVLIETAVIHALHSGELSIAIRIIFKHHSHVKLGLLTWSVAFGIAFSERYRSRNFLLDVLCLIWFSQEYGRPARGFSHSYMGPEVFLETAYIDSTRVSLNERLSRLASTCGLITGLNIGSHIMMKLGILKLMERRDLCSLQGRICSGCVMVDGETMRRWTLFHVIEVFERSSEDARNDQRLRSYALDLIELVKHSSGWKRKTGGGTLRLTLSVTLVAIWLHLEEAWSLIDRLITKLSCPFDFVGPIVDMTICSRNMEVFYGLFSYLGSPLYISKKRSEGLLQEERARILRRLSLIDYVSPACRENQVRLYILPYIISSVLPTGCSDFYSAIFMTESPFQQAALYLQEMGPARLLASPRYEVDVESIDELESLMGAMRPEEFELDQISRWPSSFRQVVNIFYKLQPFIEGPVDVLRPHLDKLVQMFTTCATPFTLRVCWPHHGIEVTNHAALRLRNENQSNIFTSRMDPTDLPAVNGPWPEIPSVHLALKLVQLVDYVPDVLLRALPVIIVTKLGSDMFLDFLETNPHADKIWVRMMDTATDLHDRRKYIHFFIEAMVFADGRDPVLRMTKWWRKHYADEGQEPLIAFDELCFRITVADRVVNSRRDFVYKTDRNVEDWANMFGMWSCDTIDAKDKFAIQVIDTLFTYRLHGVYDEFAIKLCRDHIDRVKWNQRGGVNKAVTLKLCLMKEAIEKGGQSELNLCSIVLGLNSERKVDFFLDWTDCDNVVYKFRREDVRLLRADALMILMWRRNISGAAAAIRSLFADNFDVPISHIMYFLSTCIDAGAVSIGTEIVKRWALWKMEINSGHVTLIVNRCIYAGAVSDAYMLVRDISEVTDWKPDLVVMSMIIKGLGAKGQLDEAIQVLKDLRELYRLQPDVIVINTLLYSILQVRKIPQERKANLFRDLFMYMGNSNIVPTNVTLTIVLKAADTLLNYEQALQLLNEWPKRFGVEVDGQLLSAAIDCCLSGKMILRGAAMYFEMVESNSALSNTLTARTQSRLISELIKEDLPHIGARVFIEYHKQQPTPKPLAVGIANKLQKELKGQKKVDSWGKSWGRALNAEEMQFMHNWSQQSK